ncbi:MAG: hypothetical protein AAF998_28305 [Bacteroidota bacterium]
MSESPHYDYLAEMTAEDFKRVYKKINVWRYVPWILRLGMLVVLGLSLLYIRQTDAGPLTYVMVLLIFGVGQGMAEVGIRFFMRNLRFDLRNRQKRVVEGEVQEVRRKNKSATNSGTLYTYWWEIGGEEFRIERAEFERVSAGEYVRLEILPVTGITFGVAVLPFPEADASSFP